VQERYGPRLRNGTVAVQARYENGIVPGAGTVWSPVLERQCTRCWNGIKHVSR